MRISVRQWRMLLAGSTAFLAVPLFFDVPPIGVVFAGVWMCAIAGALGGQFARFANAERFVLGMVSGIALFGAVLVILYFLAAMTVLSVIVAVLMVTAVAATRAQPLEVRRPDVTQYDWRFWLPTFAFLLGDLWILMTAFLARTSEAITSPWITMHIGVFSVYFFASFLLLLCVASDRDGRVAPFLTVVHCLTSFSIAIAVYGVGFGFDPFIHRAAERALFADGEIAPKQLLYSGQYVLVVALRHVTDLSIATIDRWLVPMLAAVSLPLVGAIGLRHGWGLSARAAQLGSVAILLIPYLPFIATVPHNFVTLMFVWILMLWPISRTDVAVRWTLYALAGFAVIVHPLLGAPSLLFVAFADAWQRGTRRMRRVAAVLAGIAFVTAVPAMFAVYNIVQGLPAFAVTNPFAHVEQFLWLLRDPLVYDDYTPPFLWEAVYTYGSVITTVLTLTTIVGVVRMRTMRHYLVPHVMLGVGMLAAIFLVRTLFFFRDIIDYEQAEFALRLLHTLVLITVPTAVAVGAYAAKRVAPYPLPTSVILGLGAIAMTLSWYMSYPQTDPKNLLSGPGVSAADIETVRTIEARSGGAPYVVLANQMTGAAALEELGFAHYLETSTSEVLWYPLPTGGELYQYFLEMSEQPSAEVMQEAMVFTGVTRGYFLVHSYWPEAQFLITEAQKLTPSLFAIETGATVVYVFEFTLQ